MSDTFDNLKISHQELMAKYADLLSNVSALPHKPCSVFKDYLLKSFREIHSNLRALVQIPILWRVFALIIELIVFIFSLFLLGFCIIVVIVAKIPVVIKFFTITTIRSHIKEKLSEIKDSYTLKFSQTSDTPEMRKHRHWLERAIKECDNLSSTINVTLINTLTRIAGIVPALGAVYKQFSKSFSSTASVSPDSSLSTASVSPDFFQIFLDNFDAFLGLGYLLLAFILFPFIHKRVFFIDNNVYYLENNLFKSLGTEKKKEVQFDFWIYFLVSLSIIAYSFTSISEDFIPIIICGISLLVLFLTRKLR